MLASTGVMAQENGNRDASGKIVRGPYETNRLFDNIWLGVGGGVNIYHGQKTIPTDRSANGWPRP